MARFDRLLDAMAARAGERSERHDRRTPEQGQPVPGLYRCERCGGRLPADGRHPTDSRCETKPVTVADQVLRGLQVYQDKAYNGRAHREAVARH